MDSTVTHKALPHSISAANTFRRCPRLYFYEYVQGWEAIEKSPSLQFGSKIDKLLEVLDVSNLENAISHIGDHFSDPYEQLDVEVLLKLWYKTFKDDPLPPHQIDHRPGNQFGFRLAYQGNEVTGLMSLLVTGYIDKVTLIAGDVGFMEGKTTKDPIDVNSAYWTKLAMDPQIACYAWALSKELGRSVNYCWYQAIRRPSPTANRLFTKTHVEKGRVIPFTLDEYRGRVEQLLTEEPKTPLVARKRIHITDEMKALWATEHGQNFLDIQARKAEQKVLEQQGLSSALAWPRNQFGCSMFGGCGFWDVCIGKTTVQGLGKYKKKGSHGIASH